MIFSQENLKLVKSPSADHLNFLFYLQKPTGERVSSLHPKCMWLQGGGCSWGYAEGTAVPGVPLGVSLP